MRTRKLGLRAEPIAPTDGALLSSTIRLAHSNRDFMSIVSTQIRPSLDDLPEVRIGLNGATLRATVFRNSLFPSVTA